MPEPTVARTEEGKTAEPTTFAAPEGPVGVAVQLSAPAELPPESFKTTESLMRWPAVLLAVQKSQDAYSSVKQRAGIINWSLNLTEKAVGSVFRFVENKARCLRPVIQYADKAVSGGVEAIEKKFPAVRESPEKLYETVKQHLTKIVRPTLDETKAISELGRRKLNVVAKIIVKKYHTFIRRVDSWMDTLEKKLNGAEPLAVPGTETAVESAPLPAAEATSPSPPSAQSESAGRLRQALQLGAQAATAVAAFQVGAAFWLLARAPLVGRFFREAPATHSSQAPPSSADVSSSSSSVGLTPLAATEQPPASQPLSTHSAPPEPSVSLPQ